MQFEKADEDVFGIDKFLSDAKDGSSSRKRKGFVLGGGVLLIYNFLVAKERKGFVLGGVFF